MLCPGQKIRGGLPQLQKKFRHTLDKKGGNDIILLYKLFRCFERRRAVTPALGICLKAGKWACVMHPLPVFCALWVQKKEKLSCT